jgi:hypothetical protein
MVAGAGMQEHAEPAAGACAPSGSHALLEQREGARARERLKAELRVGKRKAAGREAENKEGTPDWVKAESYNSEGGFPTERRSEKNRLLGRGL